MGKTIRSLVAFTAGVLKSCFDLKPS